MSDYVPPIIVGICLKLFERWLDARDKRKKENSRKK
ncbi:type I toxin-antitoxin system Fst family toxin [Lactobacillus gasseri]|nr:type I toxin-antitoxin system Fst family toxin [Lactobacillus gasseri]MDT9590658.1 type I toxin-antitoxin system Fst family toxin [Lactobacillus gasseri]MDT9622403.1 type I toxin-antitoxin system Fst family toxin [Lactobacillus gasseri]QTH67226.1 type I toxin-antitoxin system Fst family toxin [Lactobacillus gasseri]RGL15898.1 type I toxin-antitoxin system Fst family toxin [Lactobacillus gasseri]